MSAQAPNSSQKELAFVAAPTEAGSMDIALAVREVLSNLLTASLVKGCDRHEIANRISHLTNTKASKQMMDRYTAPSAPAWRFPLEQLPALTLATGDYRLLEFVVEACGAKLYYGDKAVLVEFGALVMQERAVKKRLNDLSRSVPASILDQMMGEVLNQMGGKK